jgi:iron complex transport system ATP-binding protein
MSDVDPVISLSEVGFVRDGRTILSGIDVEVGSGERWVVIGANGSGKSTLLRIMALREHPSRGQVTVLGHTLGRVDIRSLRARVGYSAPALADQFRPDLLAGDVVMTALRGALEPWWHTYGDDDRAATATAMERSGVARLAGRAFGSLSSGERQRVLLARALVTDPAVVLLDEPSSGLDPGGREDLLDALASIGGPGGPAVVVVTHHLEEVPAGSDRMLALVDGTIVAEGGPASVFTDEVMSMVFGRPLEVHRRADGRLTVWGAPRASSAADAPPR